MKKTRIKKIILIIIAFLILVSTILFVIYKTQLKKYILTEYINNSSIKEWENFEMYVGRNGITFFINEDDNEDSIDTFKFYMFDKNGKDITPKKIRDNEKNYNYSYYVEKEYTSAEHKTDGFRGISVNSIFSSFYIDVNGKMLRYEPDDAIFELYSKTNNKNYKSCAKKQKGTVVSSNSNVSAVVFESYYRGTEYDAMYYLYNKDCESINEIPYDIYPFFISDSFIVSGFYNKNYKSYNETVYNTSILYDAEIRDGKGNLIELDGIKNGEDLTYLGNDGEDIIFFKQDGIIYKLEAK